MSTVTKLAVLLRWLVVLSIPIVLIGTALRLILLPQYLQVEYRMPHFPIDSYGFNTMDRLQWATLTWRYLVEPGEEASLAVLRFSDGSPLFNEREVSHMEDVKAVVQGALVAWMAALAVLAAAAFSWRADRLTEFRRGVRHGGWLTIGLAGSIGIIVALGMVANPAIFWEFFTVFHGLFFEGESWLFAYSDTLIRLFPIRFWQDTFLAAALLILAGGSALALGVRQRASIARGAR
jgi:integral membrane protein (TIGR01906 family)